MNLTKIVSYAPTYIIRLITVITFPRVAGSGWRVAGDRRRVAGDGWRVAREESMHIH